MGTYGPAFVEDIDGPRIAKQHEAVRDHMLGAGWRTLNEIASDLGYPEASVSAQLRHLRKRKFGSYQVDKRRRNGGGTWEYSVAPFVLGQQDLFR